jgi:hypothetical protein
MKLATDVYGKEPFTKEMLRLFFVLWKDFSLAQVEQALHEHMKASPFMPKPCDIITRIKGTTADRAALAWRMVVNAIGRIGRGHSVAFPSPAYIYALNQLGGWQKLCASLTEDEVKWRGKDFERFFEIGERVATWEYEDGKVRVPRYCVGAFEASNRAQGYALPHVIDAATGKPIEGFRASLPAPDVETVTIIKELTEGMKAS